MTLLSVIRSQRGQSLIENSKVRTEEFSKFQMTGIVTKENASPVKTIKVLISMPTFLRDSEDFLIWQPKNEVRFPITARINCSSYWMYG